MQEATQPAPLTHAQRVIQLRHEFRSRFGRYRKDAELWPSVEKLMLLRPGANNSLDEAELDRLDKAMRPLRILRQRYEQLRRR